MIIETVKFAADILACLFGSICGALVAPGISEKSFKIALCGALTFVVGVCIGCGFVSLCELAVRAVLK